MKVYFQDGIEKPVIVSRARAAYLLRAARSRRAGNVIRIAGGYFIQDCRVGMIH